MHLIVISPTGLYKSSEIVDFNDVRSAFAGDHSIHVDNSKPFLRKTGINSCKTRDNLDSVERYTRKEAYHEVVVYLGLDRNLKHRTHRDARQIAGQYS